MNPGILLAFIALLAWGLDDLFIEKSTRKLGDAVTLFCVTAFGSIVLLPFVWTEITSTAFWTFNTNLLILGLTTAITTIAALADYEALRTGKLSIVEPIYALEVPVTLALSALFIGERFTSTQYVLIFIITAGIFLVASKSLSEFKKLTWERGVRMALCSAIFMGATNFLTGLSGRLTSPLAANWVIYFGLAILMLIYLTTTGRLSEVATGLRKHSKILFAVSSADLVAWTTFTYAAFYIPITLATAISEAYVALGAMLGLLINKERLFRHQSVGLILTILAVIVLSYLS